MGMEARQTFKELLAQMRSKPAQDSEVTPGMVNRDGILFDPDGHALIQVRRMTPKEAQVLVAKGAGLVFEGCGCGGGIGGCQPMWIDASALGELAKIRPRFVKGYGSPTWIDLWEGDGVRIVFAHGDVSWGDALA